VRLNEILPVPGAVDWNEDGRTNDFDEWIELYNGSGFEIDLGGWTLDNGPDGMSYRIPADTEIEPGGFLVFYRRETGIPLDDEGGEVRLLTEEPVENVIPVKVIVDFVVYGELPRDASYSRAGAGDWRIDRLPSPGAPNRPAEAR